MGFCTDYMLCNMSIEAAAEQIRISEGGIAQNMSTDDIKGVAATRTCMGMGLSPNHNSELTCFNGIDLHGGMSKGAALALRAMGSPKGGARCA
jgi:hypothetical protein